MAVTGDPRSPVAQAADVALTSYSGETSFRHGDFGTRHSVLLLVDCLYARVAQLTYERATASIALTSHIAGASTEKTGVAFFAEVIRDHQAGQPLPNVVDRARGY